MSNHFTGLSLGPPLGDQRLDLCDLYAFQSHSDPSRTVIILNANPNADALHPDAIYRLNIDNDGDLLTDLALSFVFSKPQNGKQIFNVFLEPISKSSEEDNEASELYEPEEVLGVVFPTDQDAALPLNPGKEALHEPPSHIAA